MARCFSKRWVLASLAGASMTIGIAALRAADPPKVGSVISLNVDGKGDRQFKVLKSEKQPDGSYLSELKDTKSGETITLLDKPLDGQPSPPAGSKTTDKSKGFDLLRTNFPKMADSPKAADAPKPKPRTSDPLLPQMTGSMFPDVKDKEKDKERRPILNRLFGDRDKAPAPSSESMKIESTERKPGIFNRVFGSKKPTGPSMPNSPTPAIQPIPSAPPPVLPLPPGGLNGTPPPPITQPSTPMFPTPSPTPAPLPIPIPMPMPMPGQTPVFPAPASSAAPTVPSVPSIPALPSGGYPPIPLPPGGSSYVNPTQVVIPVEYVAGKEAYDREVQPWIMSLQTMTAPSARLTAAKALAECRHASSDGVKSALFQAVQKDACGEVRAACITHLCELGYFTPHFLAHIQNACNDSDAVVRDAATNACKKMIRK